MPKLVPPDNSLNFESAEYSRLFGPGLFYIMSLVNIRIGDAARYRCAIRFMCQQGGYPVKLNAHIVQSELYNGYSKGNGGRILIEIRTNSAQGTPNLESDPICSTEWSPNLIQLGGQTRGEFRAFFFNRASQLLEKGTVYWIVFSNIHQDQVNNFVSINFSGTKKTSGHSNRWLDPFTSAVYLNAGGSTTWTNLTDVGSGLNYFSPQFQLSYSDGRSEGTFPMESGFAITPTVRMYRVQGQRKIREKFHMYGNRTFSGISFAFACETPGQIRWSIKSQEATLYTSIITENQSNFQEEDTGSRSGIGSVKWYDLELSENITFEHNKDYFVEFEQISGSWLFGSYRNGSGTGITYPAAFTLSNTEIATTGSNWKGFYIHNENSTATDANLPIVLHGIELPVHGSGDDSPTPPDSPPNSPPTGSNQNSAAVLRRAVNGISRGNEVQYIGWGQNNEGAPGAQGQGGALSIGGAARFAELEGRGEFSTCRGGTIYDGCYRCTSNSSGPVYSRARLKSWDILSPWFLLVKGHGNEVARPLVNARNFSVYFLQKGQNVWRRVYHHATNPMGWQGVYGPDMSTDYPHLQHELTSQLRQEGNYQVLGLPYNANYNNHGGMGNLAYPSQFAPETVEGYLMLAEMRLDPSTPNAVVGAQFGMDPKFNDNSLKPDAANWFPAIYLSKLQRLTPEWQQYGIVNASHQLDGQLVLDAQRGGIGLSADRLFNTTIEGFN